MHTDFWLERWNNNEIGFHQPDVNSYLQKYWSRLGLMPDTQVLVPLCGKALDLLWLTEQGHSVIGVEYSLVAIKDFFQENSLSSNQSSQKNFEAFSTDKLTMLQGDFFDLDNTHVENVAGIFDRAALIALPMEMRERYVQHLFRTLPKPIPILLVTLEYDQNEMTGPPFSVTEKEIKDLYHAHYQTIEILTDQDILDDYPQFREKGLSSLEEKVYLIWNK